MEDGRTHQEPSTGETSCMPGHLNCSVGQSKRAGHPCVRTQVNSDTEAPLLEEIEKSSLSDF